MTPFLLQVAREYYSHELESMMDYCFVFPNKRSGTFFRHYLTELAEGHPMFMPGIATIGDVAAEIAGLTEATRIDQLFTLYNEYASLSDVDAADFDRFLFWGEMILGDFNDVDRDLVDPDKLFVNLKRYREVSADFLTPEQKEILSRYWGAEFAPTSPDTFWNHLNQEKPSGTEQNFLRLWEVLAPLYHRFTKALRQRATASQGMMMREAVERLRTIDTSALPYKRYIFVGFNVLSLSELRLFGNLQTRNVADFYWDIASPAFGLRGNKAARFIHRNAALFPSLYPLEPEQLGLPEVTVKGIPSAVGEAKAAGAQIEQWIEKKMIKEPANAVDTAVVLPDENLLIPMIHSLPPQVENFNVTMGLPLRATSFASLLSAMVSMQLRARGDRFFWEDVKVLLTHPIIQRVDPQGTSQLMHVINDRRLYMVDTALATAKAPAIAWMFGRAIGRDGEIQGVYDYFYTALGSLLAALEKALPPRPKAGKGEKAPEQTPGEVAQNVEVYYVRTCLGALEELQAAVERYGMKMTPATYIRMLQQAVTGTTVSLAGEPLKGLQVMGVLETRGLDFTNVVMLSMNERIFPRRHFTRSFIPDTLRRAYGMSTDDWQETIYAYYFYRLISRAERLTLIYDARSSGGRSSEMSRYIAQMLYLFPGLKVTHTLDSFAIGVPDVPEIKVEKTDEIMEKINEYRVGGPRALSPSSINEYINCPLSFYIKHIEGINLEDEVTDYMDSALYGTILHKVMERIFKDLRDDAPEVKVTDAMLDRVMAKENPYLDQLITECINVFFNNLPKGTLTKLTGEAEVMGKVMLHFVTLMLKEEKKWTPFDFIDAEYKKPKRLEITDDLKVNISMSIDRVDRVFPQGKYGEPTAGKIRVIDYKTGIDKTSFSTMDQLFDNSLDGRRKAMVQMLFYCNAYAREERYEGPIQPMIYKFSTIATQGIQPIMRGREPLLDYRDVNEEYLRGLASALSSLFDPSVPFVQAPNEHNCKFCSFKTICRRNPS